MKKLRRRVSPPTAEAIARQAEAGKDVSGHFTNKGKMHQPAIQRVNVDFTQQLLRELDRLAQELNVSRQAVIKTYVRQGLDQHYLAASGRNAG